MQHVSMKSRLTGGETRHLFTTDVLGRHSVSYYQCLDTGFIQTEYPYWIEEAYSSPITALDLGLVSRNLEKAELTAGMIDAVLPASSRYLDFGGGYGMFTRLMRDRGYDFRHFDEYCENLFAKNFEVNSLHDASATRFELLTAWEVFEHVPDPNILVEKLSGISEVILFSTELVPKKNLRHPSDWWYFIPETGQHVSFFTNSSLEYLARKFDLHFYTDGQSNHLFSRNSLNRHPFRKPMFSRLLEVARRLVGHALPSTTGRGSLLPQDFERALTVLRERQSHVREVD